MSWGHLGLWLDSRGCKTRSRAGGLQAPPQLCWDTWRNRGEIWLQRNSRGRKDARISSIPAIMCSCTTSGDTSALWSAGEATTITHTGWGNLGQGWCFAPCNHVTCTSSAIHTLLCQGEGKCSSLLVFLPSHKSFLETRTSVVTTRDHLSSITHPLSAFRGKTVSKTTRIQALLSLTLCYSSLSAGSVSAFMFGLYAINCIMVNSCFESLTD